MDDRAETGEHGRRPPTVAETAVDYARGLGGGLFVGLPLLMTMEMWWSGFSMPAAILLLLFLLNFGVLLILERYSGFREDADFGDELEDAVTALGLALLLSAVILGILNLIGPGMSVREILGKIILESIPVSIGVSVAIGQLGAEARRAERRRRRAGFWGTQGIALAGAILFGINIAPTEEPMMLGLKMAWWHVLLLMLVSLAQVHALVYAVEFRGTTRLSGGVRRLHVFLTESVSSYAAALVVAALFLWAFGRIGPDVGLAAAVHMVVALGFATSLGAAAAKLIL